MSEDRHQCLWTARGCAGRVENGEKVPSQTEAPDTICPACEKTLERSIGEVPETWVALHAAIGNKGLGTGQRVSGSRSLPININADVDRLKVALVDVLTTAGARIAEALNLEDDPHPVSNTDAEHARVVVAACRLIAPNLPKLLASEADAVMVWRQKRAWDNDHEEWWHRDALVPEDMSGIELAYEIVRANRWGRKMLNAGERQEHACPLCHQRSVYRIVSWSSGGRTRDVMECQNCGKGWDYESYRTICNVALRAIEEEQVNEQERLEAYLAAEQLWLQLVETQKQLARFERGFMAAMDPLFAAMPAREFAETVLKESAA